MNSVGHEGNEIQEEEKVAEEERILIKIILSNEIPYIWDAEEYMILRNKHRILGSLDGASVKPFKGGHNYCQTLPIRLSRFEAHYLLKHKIALAFRIPVLNLETPEVGKEQVKQLKEQRKNEELEVVRNKRRLQIESMVDKIIEGKRRKGRGLVPDRNTVIHEEMQKVELPYAITQIDIKDPWVKDSDFISCDIPEPNTSFLERLRYKVFEDFHIRKKYYIAPGLKFGTDFVAYPGDPIDYHSQYVIVCHDKSRGLEPPYIEKQIRLASIVRKILLVAYLDEEKDTVNYVSMNKLKMSHGPILRSEEEEMPLRVSPCTRLIVNDANESGVMDDE